MLRVERKGESLTVLLFDRPVIRHSPDMPFVTVVESSVTVPGYLSERRGRVKRVNLTSARFDEGKSALILSGGDYSMSIHMELVSESLILTPQRVSVGISRVVFSFPTTAGSGVHGCGAGDVPDLKGALVPVWVKDPAAKPVVWRKRRWFWKRPPYVEPWTFTQPSFVTDSLIFVRADTPSYCELDFRGARRNRLEVWGIPNRLIVSAARDGASLYKRASACFGRQPRLPEWSSGAWLGVSGGVDRMAEILQNTIKARARISAVVLSDWSGRVNTSDGWRVFWDWAWNQTLYPKLDEILAGLKEVGVYVLAYVNPHLAIEGVLFAEAAAGGYLIKRDDGSNYVSDMGGFMAGHLDLTNQEGVGWFKRTLKTNVLELGFSGYIADLGSCLPRDAVLSNGESADAMHNSWPVLWAKLNREAIHESRSGGGLLFISNTGYAGSCLHSMLCQPGAGQSGDKPSALKSLLSMSFSGVGFGHIPIAQEHGPGQAEEFMRSTELAAFLPVMRTEDRGFSAEFDRDDEVIGHFARMSRIHAKMADYLQYCGEQAHKTGMPVVRPLGMEFPGDKNLKRIDDQYMLGDELLVAPVFKAGTLDRRVVFPAGRWVHLWSGKEFGQGEERIEAPLGRPPVFFKRDGKYSELFIFLD